MPPPVERQESTEGASIAPTVAHRSPRRAARPAAADTHPATTAAVAGTAPARAAALLVVAVLGARWLIGLLRMPSWRRPVSIAVTAAAAIALTAVTIARHDDFYDRLQFW